MNKTRHNGMFQPGQSGNPSGRPKTDQTIRNLAQKYTDEALETLITIAQNSKTSATARVQACNAILDRGWGKPIQYSENNDYLNYAQPKVSKFDLEERIEQLISQQDPSIFS